MIFGEGLDAAPTAEPAGWLRDAQSLRSGTVGGLLPTHYESYLLVEAAPAEEEDWWSAQSAIVSALADVLAQYTGTPERSWFAIWEGHGFDRSQPVRDALAIVPRFALPWRTYYLLGGHTLQVAQIRWPEAPHHWFRPDLWWPQDRSWFVATDVDFWCNYVGGTEAMTSAVAARLPTLCRPAALDDALRTED